MLRIIFKKKVYDIWCFRVLELETGKSLEDDKGGDRAQKIAISSETMLVFGSVVNGFRESVQNSIKHFGQKYIIVDTNGHHLTNGLLLIHCSSIA